MKNWISIQDYAGKYKVSISTLRRRIKADKVPHRFSDGKYFLEDSPELALQVNSLPNEYGSQSGTRIHKLQFVEPEGVRHENSSIHQDVLIESLVEEVKKAYALVVQEKDEQLRQLRGQVADLETLVGVLETENERLSKKTTGAVSSTTPAMFALDPLSQFYPTSKGDL